MGGIKYDVHTSLGDQEIMEMLIVTEKSLCEQEEINFAHMKSAF